VGFIILATPREGVKTARSGPPTSIKHFNFFCDSLSEETLVVETTRALSQTPAITRYTTCQNETSDYYNYALSERIVGQIRVYESPNAITVRKDMRTSISLANAIESLSYWTLDRIFFSTMNNSLRTYTSLTTRELMQFKSKASPGKLFLPAESTLRNLFS